MSAYSELQEREFESEDHGYAATQHQRQVGAGYFDEVAQVIAGGDAETTAMAGSTEEKQFD
jgi:isocitrate lyase